MTYNREFYNRLGEGARVSARRMVPFILELCPASSVVDVGCGDGSWLESFKDNGVSDVFGFDGEWIAADQIRIAADRFRRVALDQRIVAERRFDLCLSLEVAEHLPASRAATFVADLCTLAPLIVFSAAIPHQGGTNHINEQWPSYWNALFAAERYLGIDAIRPRFWDDADVANWYRQNMILYASEDAMARWPRIAVEHRRAPVPPASLVHPELFVRAVHDADPHLRQWLRMGGRGLRRALRRESK